MRDRVTDKRNTQGVARQRSHIDAASDLRVQPDGVSPDDILAKHKSKFVFGSCQSRKLCPEAVLTHRMGATMTTIRGQSTCGPGSYNVDIQENVRIKPTSKKGYTLGARTANLKSPRCQFVTPGPGAYETPLSGLRKKALRWHREREEHFRTRVGSPGVGTYEVNVPGCHRIPWQRDTMLKPIDLPKVQQQSTVPVNTNKLPTAIECKRYQRKLNYLKLYF